MVAVGVLCLAFSHYTSTSKINAAQDLKNFSMVFEMKKKMSKLM
jgi:hypothetical protein